MTAFIALMLAGFREARRNRVTLVVGLFAIATILLTSLVLNLTIFTLDRTVTDFGLGVMHLLLVSLALYLSVGMISREVERRTVFLVMSRPIGRSTFIAARFAGIVLTLTVLQLAMTAVYVLQLSLFAVPSNPAVGWALVGIWAECQLIAALGLFFSTFAGNLVSAISTLGLFFVGHWSPDAYNFAQRLPSPLLRGLFHVVYLVVPNLDRLDFKPEAALMLSVDPKEGLLALGTALAWCVGLVAAASLAFRKRDFK